MSRERIRPMPTAEQKARAKFEMASADPFAWAMKSVDDKFPDSREKDQKTLIKEAEVEAMVRRIMAKKRMEQRAAAEKKIEKKLEPVVPVASEVSKETVLSESAKVEEPKTEEAKAEEVKAAEPVAEKLTVEKSEVEKPEVEKSETEKAIEEAFEGDEAVTDENLNDEYYDDIEEMEDGFLDDEPVDGGIMDEDAMKTEILDEDILGDELDKAETETSEPEIMDDFDDEVPASDEEEPVKEDVNGRPVNMVLGKKSEESVEEGEMTVEVDPMTQDMKDKIRARQMDFEAEGVTKNPLIDDDKPAPEIKKVEPVAAPKSQVKLMGEEVKQKKKMMIGIIALAILALGGVLFGVVAMINQGKASEELAEQMAAMVSSASASDDMDDEYIYVKDWGLKIKIIAGLTDVSYNVANDDLAEVMIWGAKKDNNVTWTPDFARQAKNSNPLGTVVRVARYERAAAGRLIWYDDYYNYYYQGPSGIPSVSESEMNWWVESYLLIKEMLTNADNYTAMEDANTIGQQQ